MASKCKVGATDRAERIKYLSQEQLAALYKAAESGSKRDRLLLAFLYRFALRASEAVNLATADVDLREHSLRVRGLKGGTFRVYTIPADVRRVLRGYKPGERFFFESERGGAMTRVRLWQIVDRYRQAAGLPDWVTVHSLRHSAAVHCLDAGRSLEDARDLLRHRSIRTTEVYGALSAKRRGDYLRALDDSPAVVKMR